MNATFGLGLRPPFYAQAMRGEVAVDWFELISENFMVDGGKPLAVLDAVCKRCPVALHGVSLNLGGTDPLDENYLDRLDTIPPLDELLTELDIVRTIHAQAPAA